MELLAIVSFLPALARQLHFIFVGFDVRVVLLVDLLLDDLGELLVGQVNLLLFVEVITKHDLVEDVAFVVLLELLSRHLLLLLFG